MFAQPINIPITLPDGRDGYILHEDYIYEWEQAGDRWRFVVPKGFMYDGASVPRLVWTISGITPDGRIRAAATVHDEIYDCKGRIPDGMLYVFRDGKWLEIRGSVWPREEADKIFERIMIESGISPYRAKKAYYAVRAFGWTGWKK